MGTCVGQKGRQDFTCVENIKLSEEKGLEEIDKENMLRVHKTTILL